MNVKLHYMNTGSKCVYEMEGSLQRYGHLIHNLLMSCWRV